MGTLPLTRTAKKIKYLGTNFIKEVKGLYNENFKYLKKKMRKTLENGKTYHRHTHGLTELVS